MAEWNEREDAYPRGLRHWTPQELAEEVNTAALKFLKKDCRS